MKKNLFSLILILLIFQSCKVENKTTYETELRELSAKDYPNDPDVLIASTSYRKFSHSKIIFTQNSADSVFNITVIPATTKDDTIKLYNINLLTFIPGIPKRITQDEYLQQITIINQEWNRQQVKFDQKSFFISNKGEENKVTQRVDLARNCLNTGLWELITYQNQEGSDKPLYHGWFDFPQPLFEKLFLMKNKIEFSKWEDYLLKWQDPESKKLNLNLVRNVIAENEIKFENLNESFYPKQGERLKKFENIITPINPIKINDFLNDSTKFATFSPPGFYNRADPRKTELGKLAKPFKTILRDVTIKGQSFFEIQIDFLHQNDSSIITSFMLGGLSKNQIPTLNIENVNKGLQIPMGIANHSFYETYDLAQKRTTNKTNWYSFLFDKDEKWLDSHKVGIDGPLLHFDAENPNKLHLWILSFERHAFVGHYTFEIYY